MFKGIVFTHFYLTTLAMRLLLVAATVAEISPFLELHKAKPATTLPTESYRLQIGKNRITAIIAGAGLMQTAVHTTHALMKNPYHIALQAGIAGSFNPKLTPGSVVAVNSEVIADLGAEDKDQFIPISRLPFFKPNAMPYQDGVLYNPTQPHTHLSSLSGLPEAKGISVNAASGSSATIALRQQLFSPDVETMEGAAFFYACLLWHLPFCQIRAISNFVTPRHTQSWQTNFAITRLCEYLSKVMQG